MDKIMYRKNCIALIIVSILLAACVESSTSTALTPERSGLCRSLIPAGLPADASVRNSHILYEAWDYGTPEAINRQIWAVSMKDGSRRLVLEDIPAALVTSIAFTKDENQFLFAGTDQESHAQVWLSDLSGMSPVQLGEHSSFLSDFRPYSRMWSVLAFHSHLPEALDHQIGRIHSPDGKKVAVWQKGDTALQIVDKESGEEIQVLPTGDLDNVSGRWSPNGRQFTFTYYQNDEDWYTQVYIVDADGTDLHALTQRYIHSMLGTPSWSPDGQRLAFTWEGAISSTYSYRLYLLALATDEMQAFNVQVYHAGSDQDAIVWSPDGKWAAFLTDNLDSSYVQRDIQVISLKTGEVFCITQDESINEKLMDWR